MIIRTRINLTNTQLYRDVDSGFYLLSIGSGILAFMPERSFEGIQEPEAIINSIVDRYGMFIDDFFHGAIIPKSAVPIRSAIALISTIDLQHTTILKMVFSYTIAGSNRIHTLSAPIPAVNNQFVFDTIEYLPTGRTLTAGVPLPFPTLTKSANERLADSTSFIADALVQLTVP